MKRTIITTLALLYITVSSSFLASKRQTSVRPNFSGKWKLNIQESNLGKVPIAAIYEVLEISQNKNDISIMQAGVTDTKQIIPLDGSPVSIKSVKYKRTKTISISWADKNKIMKQHVTFAYDSTFNQSLPLKGVEEYSMVNEGKKLLIKRTAEVTDPKLNWEIIAIYDKQ